MLQNLLQKREEKVAITLKVKHVIIRGDVYHFRMSIPTDLRSHYGKREHIESLHTRDELEASNKATALSAKYKEEHQHLRSLSKKRPNVLPRDKPDMGASFDLSKLEHEIHVLSGSLSGMSNKELHSITLRIDGIKSEFKYAMENDLGLELLDRIDLSPFLNKTFLELCREVSGKKNLSDGILRRKVARYIIPKLKDMFQDIEEVVPPMMGQRAIPETDIRLVNGQWIEEEVCQPNTPAHNHQAHELSEKEIPLFSVVLDDCVQALTSTDKAKLAFRSKCKLVTDWLGDKTIAQYTASELRSFVDSCLMKIPRNMNKAKMWRTIPLKKCIKECTPEVRIHARTMHNYVTAINCVFLHAIDEDFIRKNPARKLKGRLPEIESQDRSYSSDEIRELLSHLKYEADRPSRYWVTLLGLFTGARLNEICQLRVSDIRSVDGVDVISINEDDPENTLKRVKNKQSIRLVPLHPTLMDYGFKHYMKSIYDAYGVDSLLFRELKYNKYSGYSRQFSRWFNEKLKPQFLAPDNESQNGFHSIRNTFMKQAQNQAEMQDRVLMEMTGHKPKQVSDVHLGYSGNLKPNRLLKEMEKLDYGLCIPTNPSKKRNSTTKKKSKSKK